VKYVRDVPQWSYARVKGNYDDSGYAIMTPLRVDMAIMIAI
jgi:hypothetical protein